MRIPALPRTVTFSRVTKATLTSLMPVPSSATIVQFLTTRYAVVPMTVTASPSSALTVRFSMT